MLIICCMNLYKLKYFYDAATLGSVTQAAEKNFITQSAVSQAIKSCEEEIGAKLVMHKKNSFELTDEGKVVLESCKTVFSELHNLKINAVNAKKSISGELRLAATNSIGLTFLSDKIAQMSKKYPQLKITLKLGNSQQVKDYLYSKEADLGFILDEDDMDDFQSTEIKKGQFLLVSNNSKCDDKIPEQLLITRQSKIEVRHLKDEFEKRYKKQFKIQMELFSWEIIKKLSLSGVGIGFLPDYVVESELKQKKLFSTCSKLKKFEYRLLAISLKKRSLSRNSQAFLEI